MDRAPACLDHCCGSQLHPARGTAGRLGVLLGLLWLLGGCLQGAGPASTLEQAAYVWQRRWSADLVDALSASRTRLTALRVLAMERDPAGRWVEAQPDLAALATDARAVVLVLRIDGFRPPGIDQAADLAARLRQQADRWQAAGVRLAGLELDHDCARARLPDYVRLLDVLRPDLPDLPLSITALPDWTGAPGWTELLARVDHAVLQVHAVDRPERGIFDAERAEAQARAFAAAAGGRRWRLALPAYGLALRTDREGRVTGIEAERPRGASPARGWQEWRADPRAVAGLLERLQVDPPPGLSGILWFRLPRAGDRRAWSWTTLAAVIDGAPLTVDFAVDVIPNAHGALDLWIRHRGSLDAEPPSLRVDGHCPWGDAQAPWARSGSASTARFEPAAGVYLRAGSRQRLGWLRCEGAPAISLQ
ncbi:MAG: DUF3142 domain-containing protein [Xanthomonadales bacterium]|jgi:hypothetical protein|nr:DUF3142 domain-containing protein [Xanthomonadales bacterium]